MTDFLTRFNAREIMGLIAVSGAFATAILSIAWCWFMSWQSHRREQALLSLKQSMIDRGFSPGEIQQVTEAGASPSAVASIV